MTAGIAFLIALAFTGTVALCVALEVVPKFSRKREEGGAARPKHFWLLFNVGTGLLLCASYLALKWAYAEPETIAAKQYNFPEKDWYFVTPYECKRVAGAGGYYTPETFSARHACKTEEVDGNPNLIKLDCTEMLNNILFMIKSESDCKKLQKVMKREAGMESVFGYELPSE